MSLDSFLLGAAFAFAVAGQIWCLIENFRRSIWLGLATMVFPPLAFLTLLRGGAPARYGLFLFGVALLLALADGLAVRGAFHH